MEIKELGHVVLYVVDLEVSSHFYRETLGFREIAHGVGMAMFSSGRTHHELLLLEVGGHARKKHLEPGLYHIGFKVGDGPESLKEAYRELKKKGVPIIGSSDHGVTHSLYIEDPDGNELELYADVSDEWRNNPSAVAVPTKSLRLE